METSKDIDLLMLKASSSFWRERIIAMAVLALDFSVCAVDDKFCSLISTNISTGVNSITFLTEVTA